MNFNKKLHNICINPNKCKINQYLLSKNHIGIILIFFLGLLPLSYINDGKMIIGGDTGAYMLNPINQLHDLYIWDTTLSDGLGFYNFAIPTAVPYLILYSFFEIIGLPLFFSEGLILSIWLIAAGLSMYFLISYLFHDKMKIAATGAAIFYMFNPYNVFLWSSPDPGTSGAYVLLPLTFALFVKGLNSNQYLKNGLLLGIIPLIFVYGVLNVPFSILNIFVLISFLIFYVFILRFNVIKLKNVLYYIIVASTLILLVNLWWILPLIGFYSEGIIIFKQMNPEKWLTEYSSYNSILHLFQLYGLPGWEGYNWGRPNASYVPNLVNNPFFIINGFLPILVITFSSILQSSYKNKNIHISGIYIYFFILYLVSIFLSKTINEPFGNLYHWFFNNIPGLIIFRSGFMKYGILIALSSAVLFGISIDIIYLYLKNRYESTKIHKSSIVLLILLVLIQNYPFLTGEVIISGKGSLPSFHHNIPPYYFDSANWINKQSDDFNIFSFSNGGAGWVVYNWGAEGTYIGTDIDYRLVNKPILYRSMYWKDTSIMEFIYQQSNLNSVKSNHKLYTFLNVKYLLLHEDDDLSFFGGPSSDMIKKNILQEKGIQFEKSFDKISVYRITDWKPLRIYGASNYYVTNNTSEMYHFIISNNFTPGKSIFFLRDQLRPTQLDFLQENNITSNINYTPKIDIQKIDATKYKLNINASQPFFLVFSESYHPKWRAYFGDIKWFEVFWKKPFDADNQFMVNGYANSWYVDKVGEYTITLYFMPQSLFYLGLTSLTIVFIFSIGYFAWIWKKRDFSKKKEGDENSTG